MADLGTQSSCRSLDDICITVAWFRFALVLLPVFLRHMLLTSRLSSTYTLPFTE